MKLTQPIKWHGGKHYLADWIISLMPPRETWHLYREPFAGGLSVLLRLDPDGLSEAVNDLHRNLIGFWRTLQSEMGFTKFRRQVEAVPFCKQEFDEAMLRGFNDWEKYPAQSAVGFFIRARQSRQGLMRDFATPTRRLRRGMNENVSAWLSAVEGLPDVHQRLKRVEIRCMEAIEFIRRYDNEAAVFYCDPPYLIETRSTGGGEYEYEMTDDDHDRLLKTLAGVKGRFLLSGYRSEAYDSFADPAGWRRHEYHTPNHASSKKAKETKVECIWTNYPGEPSECPS